MLNNNHPNLAINHYCGVDLDINKIYLLSTKNINIYQGSFYINIFIKYIWLIIPVNLYTETYSNYLNLEGRFRTTQKAISFSSKIYNDWKIFQILFLVKKILLKNNFSILNNFYIYMNYLKNIINYYYFDIILRKNNNNLYTNNIIIYKKININLLCLNYSYKWINSIISKTIYNSYLTDPITKNSKIMNICSSKLKFTNFTSINNNYI
jgi:NADH dehydrogenase/NADH:ubiquinone oxidoreductase subunit G